MTDKEKAAFIKWLDLTFGEVTAQDFIYYGGPTDPRIEDCRDGFVGGYQAGQAELREEFNAIIKKMDDELKLWQSGQMFLIHNPRPQGVMTDE